jgi:hypothetical protein
VKVLRTLAKIHIAASIMTPQARIKARLAEDAHEVGVRISVTARNSAGRLAIAGSPDNKSFYLNVWGDWNIVQKFMRRARLGMSLTSSGGFDATFSLEADVVRRLLDETELEAGWLSRNNSASLRIAQGIRDHGTFEQLPILADSLEEAGCTNRVVLDHCREGGAHGEVCWVVELLCAAGREQQKRLRDE